MRVAAWQSTQDVHDDLYTALASNCVQQPSEATYAGDLLVFSLLVAPLTIRTCRCACMPSTSRSWCYRSFCCAPGDAADGAAADAATIVLKQSTYLISRGTTGLAVWTAALYLADLFLDEPGNRPRPPADASNACSRADRMSSECIALLQHSFAAAPSWS